MRALALLWLAGCAADVVPLVAPDASRDGVDGTAGPYGVTLVNFDVPARVSEAIPTVVSVPGDGVGADLSGAPYPAVVLIHGGLVDPLRYQWLATHLATRGYVVVMPETVRHLAIFRRDDGWRALEAVRERAARPGDPLEGVVAPDGPVATMGHSLGGVVAAMIWADHAEVEAVAILASFPAASTDVEERDGAVLSIIGSQDGSASIQGAWDGYNRFAAPGFFGIVDGMNHFDWTDAASASDLRRDGTPTRPQEDTRRDALRVVDAFLDGSLRDDADAWARLDAGFDHVAESP